MLLILRGTGSLTDDVGERAETLHGLLRIFSAPGLFVVDEGVNDLTPRRGSGFAQLLDHHVHADGKEAQLAAQASNLPIRAGITEAIAEGLRQAPEGFRVASMFIVRRC